jgi:hypothetical protein
MTAVDPASQLAALIRVQVAALRRRHEAAGGKPDRRHAPPPAESAGATPDLASVVADRIRALERDDPQRERKAFRFFLETVILSELGQALVNDPSFPVMLDHVQQQMESDPELAQAAREAAQVLLAAADGNPTH